MFTQILHRVVLVSLQKKYLQNDNNEVKSYAHYSNIFKDILSGNTHIYAEELFSDLTWAKHINKTCNDANRNLGFIRRNLPIRNSHVKEIAYKGLVRPILEYCSTVWDPHHIKKYKYNLEMVQQRPARFTLGRFHNRSSPTEMLQQLQWETLMHLRRIAKQLMFFNIQHELVAVPQLLIVTRPPRLRPAYPHHFLRARNCTDVYKNSFFPLAITQWNSLPTSIACRDSLPSFQADLSSFSF